MKVQQHPCNTHSSSQSSCRSEYEVSYGALDRQPSLSPPPPSSSNLSSTSWAHNTAAGSNSFRAIQSGAPSSGSRYHHNSHNNSSSNNDHHILHSVMGSSRVTKTISQSTSRQVARYNSQPYHHPHQPIVASQRGASSSYTNQFPLQNGPMSQAPYSSEYRSSPYRVPRGNRLPTLVDRIKAALAVQPSRQPGMHSYTDHSPAYTSQPSSDYHSPSPSATPMPIPTPTLYGIRCTEVSQKAYSGQTSAMKPGFDRLQRLDSGKVEYRTIAFCTHLTVSRWEATTAATAMTTDSSEGSAATSAATSSRNNPAQLMSLANYIRHILSLTAGNPNAQPPQQVAVTNQPQKQEGKQTSDNSNNNAQELHTSNTRPLKAMSNRRHRHRFSPDYHDHSGRHARHQQQYSDEPLQGQYDQGYREGNHNNYDLQHHSASSHFQRQQQQPHHYQDSYQHQQDQSYPPARRSESPNAKSSGAMRHLPQPINTSRSFVPPQQELPKVPFPNLTLTLALIYVDRLKAKNPEAKGEPGCSHRLFLIAFIIAAKYRCSVALSPSQSQEATHSENSLFYDPPVVPEDDEEEEKLSLESRLNSELIFSNHAWVRLLNLGSFARIPTSATGGSGPTGQTPTSPMMTSVPPSPQASETSTMASNTPVPTTPTQGQTPTQAQPLQSLSSIMHSASGTSAGGASHSNNSSVSTAGTVLQVEDLDRMEAEFLTFLNFDLATMTHDLETCWNLLVGKKDA